MKTSPTYASPAAFKQALEQRLRTASTTGVDFARRRQLLVFDRFLARVVQVMGDTVLLKGGLVIELRMERVRTTKDVDLRLTGSSADALERLQQAGRLDLGDFLAFEIRPDSEHPDIAFVHEDTVNAGEGSVGRAGRGAMRHVVVLIAVLGICGCYGSSGNEGDAGDGHADVVEDAAERADEHGAVDADEGPDDVPEAGDDDGPDEVVDFAEADASDARLCRAGTGYCRTDYDPGCPPTIPADGSPCGGPLYCDYCDSSYPPYWTTANCHGGRWEVGRVACDPAL